MNQRHLTDEEVEDFARSALAESRMAGVEDHLLLCEKCRSSVDELDKFVAFLRGAVLAHEAVTRQSGCPAGACRSLPS